MSDTMTDEELMAFLRENRDRIRDLIGEDAKEGMKDRAEKVKERITDAEDSAEQAMKGFIETLFSKDVQRHFIGAGMEMMLGFDALFRTMPFPDKMRKAADRATGVRENISEMYCEKNPDCLRKRTPSNGTSRIEID